MVRAESASNGEMTPTASSMSGDVASLNKAPTWPATRSNGVSSSMRKSRYCRCGNDHHAQPSFHRDGLREMTEVRCSACHQSIVVAQPESVASSQWTYHSRPWLLASDTTRPSG